MDTLRKMFKDTRTTALTLGVGTVVVTHVAMLMDLIPDAWSNEMKKNHAVLNLVASGAIVYGTTNV